MRWLGNYLGNGDEKDFIPLWHPFTPSDYQNFANTYVLSSILSSILYLYLVGNDWRQKEKGVAEDEIVR